MYVHFLLDRSTSGTASVDLATAEVCLVTLL